MTADSEDITLTAQCLCKAYTFDTQVPRSKLPLEGLMCHCTSCRNLTGAMYNSDVDWPGPADRVLNSDLKHYIFSTDVSVFFCGTCSTPIFWNEHYADRPQNPSAFTGALKKIEVKELIRFTKQIFLGDTNDGGVSPWLQNPSLDGTKPRLWRGRPDRSEELSDNWAANQEASRTESAQREDIPLHCRCKGVDLVFRPNTVDFSTMDADSMPAYIDPKSHKHLTTLDPCNSYRLSIGIDMISWTFMLLKQIDFPGNSKGSSFPHSTHELKDATQNSDRDPQYGTLAMYRSSPDIQRYFFSRCSASIFYAVDDRPDLVNMAIGLLHTPEGARAKSILAWHLGAKIISEEEHKGG